MRAPPRRVVSLTPLAIERDSRTYKQAASLARLGYESVVVEAATSQLDGREPPFEVRSAARVPSADQSPLARLGHVAAAPGNALAWRYARRLHTRARFLRRSGPATARVVPRASLYVLHGPTHLPALMLRDRVAPYIYDAHDFYPSVWDAEDPVHQLMLRFERRCVQGAAAVTTTTDGYADLYERHYGRRPVVIPNVHDRRIDEPVEAGVREAIGAGAEQLLIVMIGNDKPGTAVEETLAGMKLLPGSVQLAFVGNGWESWRGRVAELGLEERVHLLPALAPTQVGPFIAGADLAAVLYYPLTVDYRLALPNRLFIPISMGLPVLYPSDLDELDRLARRHELGIGFDTRSPQSFAETVRPFAEDRSRLAPLREATARAGEELSWEREEERLGELVRGALGAPAGTGA